MQDVVAGDGGWGGGGGGGLVVIHGWLGGIKEMKCAEECTGLGSYNFLVH